MGSPFDNQPDAEPLPIADRRHSDQEAAQRRQTNFLIAIAIALPILAAVVLVVCLVMPLLRGSRDAAPASSGPQPGSVSDWQTRREMQRQQAEERAEEELREIRERVDRAFESKQREARRRDGQRPPRQSESGDKGDRTLDP